VKPEQIQTYKIIARNKKEGIALLYERYGKRLHRYAQFNWKLSEDEAWDVVYKTLYKVLESTSSYSFDSEKKFGSFVFKVFVNYLRQNYRDTKKLKEHLSVANYETTEISPVVEEEEENNSEKMSLLKSELEKFEDWERILLLLRSQNMPYGEIAKYVNKPEEQLKVYYQRLKTTLAKRMNDKLNPK
jgi:RNA polymerase sigma-70 factor (ECF subfamily)